MSYVVLTKWKWRNKFPKGSNSEPQPIGKKDFNNPQQYDAVVALEGAFFSMDTESPDGS